jgi:hypothetical protein
MASARKLLLASASAFQLTPCTPHKWGLIVQFRVKVPGAPPGSYYIDPDKPAQ